MKATLLLVATVSVELAELPLAVTDAGEYTAVAPAGSPEAESVIAFENALFTGVSVMGYCALAPRVTVCGLFETPIEKSIGGGPCRYIFEREASRAKHCLRSCRPSADASSVQ